MRILVTGASGFVGNAVCAQLERSGHDVIRSRGPGKPPKPGSFSIDVGDPSTFPSTESVLPVGAIVHCAGIAHRFGRVSDDDFHRVNVKGVENIVRFGIETGARKFVLVSSVLVYGTPQSAEPITEEHTTEPDDSYGRSKLEGESVAIRMCEKASVELSILRPVPIIGEGSRGNVSRLIKAIDRGLFVWMGDGRNLKSFVSVQDVAWAIGKLVEKSSDRQRVFNIVGGTLSVAELVGSIEKALGKRSPRIAIPTLVAHAFLLGSGIGNRISPVEGYRRTLRTWLSDAVYSGNLIEKDLGFTPATTIEAAIGREVEHYLKMK